MTQVQKDNEVSGKKRRKSEIPKMQAKSKTRFNRPMQTIVEQSENRKSDASFNETTLANGEESKSPGGLLPLQTGSSYFELKHSISSQNHISMREMDSV